MQHVDHEEHLDEAHDTHTLATSCSVKLLTEVETAALRMAEEGLEQV